jgi:hypothetical protein
MVDQRHAASVLGVARVVKNAVNAGRARNPKGSGVFFGQPVNDTVKDGSKKTPAPFPPTHKDASETAPQTHRVSTGPRICSTEHAVESS